MISWLIGEFLGMLVYGLSMIRYGIKLKSCDQVE